MFIFNNSLGTIEKAQKRVARAVGVFDRAMDELVEANIELENVIDLETKTITQARETINTASNVMEKNNRIIGNLAKLTG